MKHQSTNLFVSSAQTKNLMLKAILTLIACSFVLMPMPAFALEWGTPKREGCIANQVARYSSLLYHIPHGRDWGDACRKTPLRFEGKTYKAKACNNVSGLQMWGEFDVKDYGCTPSSSFSENMIIGKGRKYGFTSSCFRKALEADNKYYKTDGCSVPLKDSISLELRDTFFQACVFHDTCYTTPGATQAQCDNGFYAGMVTLCNKRYGVGKRSVCLTAAASYRTLLSAVPHGYLNGQRQMRSPTHLNFLGDACELTEGVNGRNLTFVAYNEGKPLQRARFEKHGSVWTEYRSNTTIKGTFRETHRDEWSVYLARNDIDEFVQLDIFRKIIRRGKTQNAAKDWLTIEDSRGYKR